MTKLGHWSVSKKAKIYRYTCFKGSRKAQLQKSGQLLDSSATSLTKTPKNITLTQRK